jgi:RNA polymerase sigma-70 factor (ECF subfamily)
VVTQNDATDEQLIGRFRGGDDRAFEVVFLRYRDRTISYAWRMLRRREEAEEVALEAFTRIVNGAWQPKGSFKSFLFSVVHRLCIDRLRRRSRVARLLPKAFVGMGSDESPETALIEDERRRDVEAALTNLGEDHRAAVLLYYGQEMRSKEVADILGCSDQQVRSKLSYARRRLRVLLDESEGT